LGVDRGRVGEEEEGEDEDEEVEEEEEEERRLVGVVGVEEGGLGARCGMTQGAAGKAGWERWKEITDWAALRSPA
jgi:hypothetical protein